MSRLNRLLSVAMAAAVGPIVVTLSAMAQSIPVAFESGPPVGSTAPDFEARDQDDTG